MKDNVFKTLLEKITPSVLTEEQAAELQKAYDDHIDQVKLDAQQEGEAVGFEKGYEEGKKIARAEAQAEFDKLADQMDTESTEMLTEIVRMLDENTTEKLQEVYDVLKKKEEELVAEKEKALAAQDEDYANKMDEIVEAIDTKHAKLLMEAKEKMESSHAAMLKECVQKLKSKHAKEMKTINEKVENYLAYALQQHIPDAHIIQEEKFNVAKKTLEKISDLLAFNKIIQESADGSQIFNQYNEEINAQKEQINKLISENISLKSENDIKEAQIVLEQKLHNLTPATQEFVRKQVEGITDKKVICEKVEDAVKAYRKQQAERRQELMDSVKTNKPSTIVKEDTLVKPAEAKGKTEIISESAKTSVKSVVEAKPQRNSKTSDVMDFYVKCLTKHNK